MFGLLTITLNNDSRKDKYTWTRTQKGGGPENKEQVPIWISYELSAHRLRVKELNIFRQIVRHILIKNLIDL